MHSITDIVLINDVINLPKKTLEGLCTDLNLDNSGYKGELVNRIYQYINSNDIANSDVFESSKQKLLAGKVSVTWYRIDEGLTTDEFREKIVEKADFNPFENMSIPDIEELTTDPVLIGGSKGINDSEIYLRFAYKNGVRQEPYGTGVNTTPRGAFATVLFDTNSGIVEIRGDSRKAEDIAVKVAALLDQQVNLERIEAPFNQTIGNIADSLEGELIDSTSKPELILDDFAEEQTEAIVNVLQALDDYFRYYDTEVLEEKLNQANTAFDEQITVPFSALMLSGMGKVGLGGEKEIRQLPLYAYLNPNLQHQGGFVRFNYTEEGVEKSYTIRVGMTTKSIFFTTPVTENIISYVRSNVLV
uniref:hypothetical protein n=1 Tax=uncultured Allobacillus sp. TaxID=1638025 RepID=UPI00259AA068|nr:hypothetical protein [uncultured Allobacillus sp.]